MTRFVALLVLAAALAACDIDFTEVTDSRDPPIIGPLPEARLNVDVMIDDRPLPELRLVAYFWPGAMEDGAVRGVSNDTLYLGEQAVLPRATSDGGMRDYWWGPGPEAEYGTLSMTPPVVEGLAALPPVLLRTYHRVGADTIRAAAGDTLRFEVVPHPAAADEPFSTSWGLHLRAPGGSLNLGDTTAVPTLVTVPAEWVAWAGTDPVHVSLSVREVWRRELPDSTYSARVAMSRELTWTVVWTPR